MKVIDVVGANYFGEWNETGTACRFFIATVEGTTERRLTEREKKVGMEPRWIPLEEAIDIFSKHASYAATDEMRRGIYLREYTALSELKHLIG